MKFVIDRKKWRCGQDGANSLGRGETKLLNAEGYMCCLGQICEQSGISREVLLNKLYPPLKGVDWLSTYVSEDRLYMVFVKINDNRYLTNESREEQIKRLASQYGHEVEFIN